MIHTTSQLLQPKMLFRTVLPAICSIWLVWLLFDTLSDIDLAQVQHDISLFDGQRWLIAVVCAWVSFVAVSRYDHIIAKYLGLKIPKRRAISMSWKATAISQLVGFGLITGSTVRWFELSCNPNRNSAQTATQAFKLTAAVSLSFLAAWVIVTVLSASAIHIGPLETGAILLCLFAVVSTLSNNWPQVRNGLQTCRGDVCAFVVLTFIDTFFAALIIFVFLPTELAPLSTIYLAFLLSYTVGLISGLPGGIGPFEICMLTFLPNIDPSLLAPALIGFRIVYFAIPATIAVGLLGLQLASNRSKPSPSVTSDKIPSQLRRYAPPVADLMLDNHLKCFSERNQTEAALIYQTNSAIIQLSDPFGRLTSRNNILISLKHEANWSKRSLCVYRSNKATALRAQNIGMQSFRVSTEATLSPALFDLNTSKRSGLRRKIRKSAKAGVTINTQTLEIKTLSNIDQQWRATHGTARGFSTGTFSEDLIKRQRLYVAYQHGKPIAFITFSAVNDLWLLDLIRYGPDCPDGTIYALVAQAIEDARLCNVNRLSLGCVPLAPPCQSSGVIGWAQNLLFERAPTLKGLYQFKKAFDPDWQDRYVSFGSLLDAIVTIASIATAIFSERSRHEPTRGS